MDDDLEARAIDDQNAQRALLAARAEQLAHPALLDASQDPVEMGERALDLLGSLAVDPRSLGEQSAEHAAIIARHLARTELVAGRARSAIEHLRSAERWQSVDASTLEARAEAKCDLAQCFELLEEHAGSEQAWREALVLSRAMIDGESRSWLVRRCADALSERARSVNDHDALAALEREWNAADDADIARQLHELEPAVDFFTARWSGDEPPKLHAIEAWLRRSTGAVRSVDRSERDRHGLRSALIFGSSVDFVCLCGERRDRSASGAVCDECGVEISRAARSLARIGHIELPATIVHPAALERGPAGSLVSLALDTSDERVREVLRGTRCLRRAIDAPRGADPIEPNSAELRAYDEGRGDPAIVIATGYEAVLSAMQALDVEGALAECAIEQRAFEAHRGTKSATMQARLSTLSARRRALELLLREGASAVCVTAVPVWSERWLCQRGAVDPATSAYRALIERCALVGEPWSVTDVDRVELAACVERLCEALRA